MASNQYTKYTGMCAPLRVLYFWYPWFSRSISWASPHPKIAISRAQVDIHRSMVHRTGTFLHTKENTIHRWYTEMERQVRDHAGTESKRLQSRVDVSNALHSRTSWRPSVQGALQIQVTEQGNALPLQRLLPQYWIV